MTDAIVRALGALEDPGSFAVRLRAPATDLELSVTKVGALDFPLQEEDAQRLLRVAARSPFGLGEKTIVDPRVRSGWEVRKTRVKINGRRWNPALRGHLATIQRELGLSSSGRLEAALDKLTIYGPGEFFKLHQDSEKGDSMLGTLVVLLPSRFTGGAIHIDRQGARAEYRRTARSAADLELIAFYADCHHEVRPVKSGYRVALIYQLRYEAGSSVSRDMPSITGAQRIALRSAIARHFDTPQLKPYARDGETFVPEKLVYLLDHQYTQRNLSWTQLKQSDIVRASALREVAGELGLELHLALAEIQESWECEPERSSYRSRWSRRSRWDDGKDEDDEAEAKGVTPTDLINSDVGLDHWLDESGAPVEVGSLRVLDAELCFTAANDTQRPLRSHYEGYMGNWGDTLDRWYRRAAIVLWPRSRAFITEVRGAPQAAIKRLVREARSAKPGDERVASKLAQLLEVWTSCVRGEPKTSLVVDVLRLAAVAGGPELAETLLAPMRSHELPASGIKPLLALARRHDVDRCVRALTAWHELPRWDTWRPPWRTGHSYTWLGTLVQEGGEHGGELARVIVGKQWAELQRELDIKGPGRLRSPFADARRPELREHVLEVLRACRLVGDRQTHDALASRLLAEDSPLTPLETADVVEGALRGLRGKARTEWGLDALRLRCRDQLAAAAARPPRHDGDWSITVSSPCDCDDCGELRVFLESPEARTVWPLAKARRRHIHEIIERLHLPVDHETQRVGSPFKLTLTKTAKLFQLEQERRALYKAALKIVQKPSGSASGRSSTARPSNTRRAGARKARA